VSNIYKNTDTNSAGIKSFFINLPCFPKTTALNNIAIERKNGTDCRKIKGVIRKTKKVI
jgi:hypothetical protein